jgi:hypothetical protein
MDDQKFGRAPDFTTACIVMFGVNLSWILFLLFAIYGLIIAVFAALVVNHLIKWIELRKHEAVPVASKTDR